METDNIIGKIGTNKYQEFYLIISLLEERKTTRFKALIYSHGKTRIGYVHGIVRYWEYSDDIAHKVINGIFTQL